MRRLSAIVLFVLSFAGSSGYGQTAEDVFNRANGLYREGRFREAVDAYNSILDQGLASAALYFNLGNSHYRLGNVAQSILAYERARRIEPSDPDVAFNLSLANLRTADRIDAVPELFLVTWAKSLANLLPSAIIEGILVVSWVAFFGVLSFLNIVPSISQERFFRLFAIISLAFVVVAGGMLILQVIQTSDQSAAIVVGNVVTAKASPDEQSVDTFVIHEGLKVHIEDSVGEWVRISLADGKVGWVPAATCEVI